MNQRSLIQNSTRQKIKEKFNNKCAICGTSGTKTKLHVSYIVPYSLGGECVEDNLLLLCPNCHAQMASGPKEFEYVRFLYELLNSSGKFSSIEMESLLGSDRRARADLLAKTKSRHKPNTLIIECKSHKAISKQMSSVIVEQLYYYQKVYGQSKLVFSIPARLPSFIKEELTLHDIEVWDIDYIISNYLNEIRQSNNSYFKSLFLTIAGQTEKPRALELLERLKEYEPGKKDWNLYQKLVGEILEHVFSPPLNKPVPEVGDKYKANRRDFIMPNYTTDGFWYYLRVKYSADYIVIDAKNYSKKVKKNDVLQIANYLKPHGLGNFGIIFSRKGGDSAGCEHTLREQWMVNKKMIIVLDDNDVEAMLTYYSGGEEAADVIGQKIEAFRFSM